MAHPPSASWPSTTALEPRRASRCWSGSYAWPVESGQVRRGQGVPGELPWLASIISIIPPDRTRRGRAVALALGSCPDIRSHRYVRPPGLRTPTAFTQHLLLGRELDSWRAAAAAASPRWPNNARSEMRLTGAIEGEAVRKPCSTQSDQDVERA